jgi:hypothetical protein
MNNRVPIPAMQPKMQTVVLSKEKWIVCHCGGKGLIFQAAFLADSLLVGSKPEITPIITVMCSKCGEDITPPFTTLGDITKES